MCSQAQANASASSFISPLPSLPHKAIAEKSMTSGSSLNPKPKCWPQLVECLVCREPYSHNLFKVPGVTAPPSAGSSHRYRCM